VAHWYYRNVSGLIHDSIYMYLHNFNILVVNQYQKVSLPLIHLFIHPSIHPSIHSFIRLLSYQILHMRLTQPAIIIYLFPITECCRKCIYNHCKFFCILTGATLLILIPLCAHSNAKVIVKLWIPARAAPECLKWHKDKYFVNRKKLERGCEVTRNGTLDLFHQFKAAH